MGSPSRTAAADCGEISALRWLALILLFLKHMNNHATQSLCTWALLMISDALSITKLLSCRTRSGTPVR